MNGVLNVLKPSGMTSFDVVAYLRGVLKVRKAGHAGTLDPGAAGVLPVCVGSATRAVEYMAEKDKSYRAELTLGISTDTQDSSGRITGFAGALMDDGTIIKAVEGFAGKQAQVPPMHSAVKVGGIKLYELARRGGTVERKPRNIEIYKIKVINIKRCPNEKIPSAKDGGECIETIDAVKVMLDVTCSKGTYIRTLCADIGERLGCGGHMSYLVRTRVGNFDISSALTLEEICGAVNENRLKEKIMAVDRIFDELEPLAIKSSDAVKFLNGAAVRIDRTKAECGERVRVYDGGGCFIAIGLVFSKEGKLFLKPEKIFLQGEQYESNIRRESK